MRVCLWRQMCVCVFVRVADVFASDMKVSTSEANSTMRPSMPRRAAIEAQQEEERTRGRGTVREARPVTLTAKVSDRPAEPGASVSLASCDSHDMGVSTREGGGRRRETRMKTPQKKMRMPARATHVNTRNTALVCVALPLTSYDIEAHVEPTEQHLTPTPTQLNTLTHDHSTTIM